MKKHMMAVLCAVLLILSGCTPHIETAVQYEQVYTSFFPIYALSGLVLEDIPDINLKCLIQPQDDCLRLYDLSDWDASVLAYDADAIIICGNGLESFESSLYTFGDKGPAVITATYGLELYNSDGTNSIEGPTGHMADANPYLYMSVSGARKMTAVIAESIAMLYPDMAADIASGYAEADARLAELEENVFSICSNISGQKVILMNEALIYPAMDYGLDIVCRYDRESGTTLYGESLESAIVMFKETGAEVIFIEKQAPAELTSALEDAGFTVVYIDIMSSYPIGASPERYFDVQIENANSIAAAYSRN